VNESGVEGDLKSADPYQVVGFKSPPGTIISNLHGLSLLVLTAHFRLVALMRAAPLRSYSIRGDKSVCEGYRS
jgi:hypothetical protein